MSDLLGIDLRNESCGSMYDLIDLLLWDSSTPPSKEEAAQMYTMLQNQQDKCVELEELLEDYMSTFGQ